MQINNKVRILGRSTSLSIFNGKTGTIRDIETGDGSNPYTRYGVEVDGIKNGYFSHKLAYFWADELEVGK